MREEMLTPKERSVVVAKNLGYTLPTGEVLFDGIELAINKGDRIALVGKNGVGKSTLMKILAGVITSPKGTVDYASAAYVDQLDEGVGERGNLTLMEYLSKSSEEWWQIQLHYEKMFGRELPDMSRSLKQLSGGEYMRLKLAVATYKEPEILLLDEPTNHLDVSSKEVLRDFIEHFSGGVMVVSHDVHFIDQVAKDVWELSEGKLKRFGGNYQEYLQAKAIEEESRERRLGEAQKELAQSERAMIKEQKRAARSRRTGKKLAGDRSMSTIEKGYFKNKASSSAGRRGESIKADIDEAKEKVEANKAKKRKMARLNLVEGETLKGKRLIEIRNGTLTVGGTELIQEINLTIKFGERILLAGENGSGKTTLVKSILAETSPTIKLRGEEVFRMPELSGLYISQRYEQIDRNKSLIENMYLANPGIDMQAARRALGNLLFREKHEVEKKAGSLSGGETARLAFAMASVSPVDMLILDEPTNNLDRDTIQIIVDALSQYEGAMLVVSHDIGFLKQIDIEKAYVITAHRISEMQHLPSEEGFYGELLTK
jgi:ATPase subunit of ABC transporter with duplicated ATPase domains